MITTKTSDRLAKMASELTAIGEALDDEGHRGAAYFVLDAARKIAHASSDLEEKLRRYVRSALAEEPKA